MNPKKLTLKDALEIILKATDRLIAIDGGNIPKEKLDALDQARFRIEDFKKIIGHEVKERLGDLNVGIENLQKEASLLRKEAEDAEDQYSVKRLSLELEYIYLGVPKRTLQKMGLIKPQTDGTEYPEDEREKVSQAVAEKLAKSDASIAALQLAPHGIWAYYNQKIAEIDRKKRQWNDLHNQFKDILGVGMREAVLEDYVGHGEDETHDTD